MRSRSRAACWSSRPAPLAPRHNAASDPTRRILVFHRPGAVVTAEIAGRLSERQLADGSREELIAIARASSLVATQPSLSAEVIRAQVRSAVVVVHEREPTQRPVAGRRRTDVVGVDTTWGETQPLEAAPGVRTVGELELVDLVGQGASVIDSRTAGSFGGRAIPGSVNIPHDEMLDRKDELDRGHVSILFCNGPHCPQSPRAIRQLLDDGYPVQALAYYRGGMHDWVTQAMPTKPRGD